MEAVNHIAKKQMLSQPSCSIANGWRHASSEILMSVKDSISVTLRKMPGNSRMKLKSYEHWD